MCGNMETNEAGSQGWHGASQGAPQGRPLASPSHLPSQLSSCCLDRQSEAPIVSTGEGGPRFFCLLSHSISCYSLGP